MKKLRKNQLTIDDLVELICDVAYEQAIRDVSGGNWFNSFIEKIDRKNQKNEIPIVRQLTREYEIRCPHCNSNAVDSAGGK